MTRVIDEARDVPPTAASRTQRRLIWKHQIVPLLHVPLLALQAFLVRDLLAGVVDDPRVLGDPLSANTPHPCSFDRRRVIMIRIKSHEPFMSRPLCQFGAKPCRFARSFWYSVVIRSH